MVRITLIVAAVIFTAGAGQVQAQQQKSLQDVQKSCYAFCTKQYAGTAVAKCVAQCTKTNSHNAMKK